MYETVPLYLFSMAVLLILMISILRDKASLTKDRKLFLAMMFMNFMLLLFDYIQIRVNGLNGSFFLIVNHLSSILIYLSGMLLTMSWYFYVDYYIHKDGQRLKKYWLLIIVPFIFNAVLALLSPAFGFYFKITDANIYKRGSLFLVNAFFMYYYLIIAFKELIQYRHTIRRQSFIPMLLFVLPPSLGGILQVLSFGLLLIWPMATLSCLMVYVFVQMERASIDFLTGLFNKREFESYMANLEKSHLQLGKLAGYVIDLNRFKQINDTYGHDIGDEALKSIAHVIKSSFRSNDFVTRFGGDEFAVILFIEHEQDLQRINQRLVDQLKAFNAQTPFPFQLEFSFGSDIYRSGLDNSVEKFMRRLDEMMYIQKQETYAKEKHNGRNLH